MKINNCEALSKFFANFRISYHLTSMDKATQAKVVIALKIIFFCVLVYFPFFLHLDKLPIRVYDEARLAVSAFEMSENGNFLVPYHNNEPDMWSTKPPIMIWLQVFFIKLLGVGELAIRLPSAIAAFLTTVVLMVFSVKYLKSYWLGIISVLVLVTSYGYIEEHAVRTGDYDALLTFFTTSFLISIYLFIETKRIKYLHIFYFFLTLAILTKSVQGMIFLPAILIYIILRMKWCIFKNKWLYLDFLMCAAVVGAYYGLREFVNPGYLEAVWNNELGGRYMTALSNHTQEFNFYYNMLINHHYANWYWLVPCGIVIGLFTKNTRYRNISLFLCISILVYFFIISSAETKLQWYEVPLFPLLALSVAFAIYLLFELLRNASFLNKRMMFNVLPLVLLFIVFLDPYVKTFNRVYFPKDYSWHVESYHMSYYLQDAIKGKINVEDQYIVYESYCAHLLFYVEILNKKKQNVILTNSKANFKEGDKLSAYQHEVFAEIDSKYHYDIINENKRIKTLVITGMK